MKHPPFCPNSDCEHHQIRKKQHGWFYNDGYYSTKSNQQITRFQCKSCKKRFSAQTFSMSFFLKKKGSFDYIFKQLKATAGIRDISRDLGISPASVLLRITRLARQSVCIHSSLRHSIKLNENLVADGFESFAVSQYFPNNINILGGKNSQYLYTFDYSHLKRKGCMTSKQKKRNKILQERFNHRTTISESFTNICQSVSNLLWKRSIDPVILYTDKKKEYKNVLSNFHFPGTVFHICISSKQARTILNDLFTVNYIDRQVRMCCAEHVRETMRFARNVNNSMERLAVFRLYHNYLKPYRINRKDDDYRDRTHAEVAGISKKDINREMKTFFTRRRFVFRCKGIEKQDLLILKRCYVTPLSNTYEHVPAYAA